MLLIDLNQVILAGIMVQLKDKSSATLNEGLVRHMVINIIRGHVKKFKNEYGEIILCCDSRKYWRKEFFPFYKASRKKNRAKSNLDWHLIFEILSKLKDELKEYFPYKVIDVEPAEADDIIGTLVPMFAPHQSILILSSDGDFLQLQRYGKNVKQYNPITKKYLKSVNPALELKEKIIRGDSGDGIPNIFSPGDSFVLDKKQKAVTVALFESHINTSPDTWNETASIGFSRNQTLIDLTYIPIEVKEKIIATYEETKVAPRQKMLNYFMKNKMMNLIECIEDF